MLLRVKHVRISVYTPFAGRIMSHREFRSVLILLSVLYGSCNPNLPLMLFGTESPEVEVRGAGVLTPVMGSVAKVHNFRNLYQ